jgi:hypothetical protein
LFLVVTGGGLVSLGFKVADWYDRTYDWRNHEYRRLGQLHSGFTLSAFIHTLGTPLLETSNQKWSEYIFHGRDYWVQALVREGRSTVDTFSVTSCAPSFKPTFRLSGIGPITLHRSSILEYNNGDARGARAFHSFIPANGGGRFLVTVFGAHVFNFTGYAWGVNESCPGSTHFTAVDRSVLFRLYKPYGDGPYSGVTPALARHMSVNTYGEWAPSVLGWPYRAFEIGIDETSINTIAGRCLVGCLGNR